jgi:proliferating cell nuclear antigen
MKIVISNKKKVDKLVTIFRHLKSIVIDVNLNFTDKGLYIQSMDSSHACLVEISIRNEWFDKFTIKKDEVLGINTEMLFKVIDCWNEGQEITIYTNNKKTNRLFIDFTGEKKPKKKFNLPLIDIESDILEIPEKDYDVDLSLKSNEFKELITELAIFNNTINFECKSDSDKINIKAEGQLGTMEVEITDEDINEMAITENLTLSVSYAISYICTMCNFSRLNKDVYIHSSEDVPIKIHYSIDEQDSIESKNYIRFYLAPKLYDDEY